MKKNKLTGVIIYFVIILLLIFGVVSVLNMVSGSSRRDTVTYSDIISEFDNLNVSKYELDLGSGLLRYYLKGTENDPSR